MRKKSLKNEFLISSDLKEEIKNLYAQGNGTRKIASILCLTRTQIIKVFEELKIGGNKNLRRVPFQTTKQCSGPCNLIKSVSNFYQKLSENGYKYCSSLCYPCEAARAKEYALAHKASIQMQHKKYRKNNSDTINNTFNQYVKHRKQQDPNFKLRRDVSSLICACLKKIGSSKAGNSVLKYLPYSIQDLKQHLESQFEPWMTWSNWGKYDSKSWDDNDTKTWTWNIDHIIPKTHFIYGSPEDEEFKKCWALSNLRPYSAKQNIIEGNRR